MKLTRIVATAMTASAVGLGAAAWGMPTATASPAVPAPLKPGHGNDDCFPFCNRGPGGPDFNRGQGNGHWGNDDHQGNNDHQGNDDHWGDHDRWGDKGPWWAGNRHDWWDDRNGPPPWGWGPPPPVNWRGGPLPPSIDYWGYRLNPVWDNGFRQWGVWLFGVWIPIFGVG